jgi:hypothetical protein
MTSDVRHDPYALVRERGVESERRERERGRDRERGSERERERERDYLETMSMTGKTRMCW